MSWFLGWEESDPQTAGACYKAVVQATLLFGAKLLVMSPCIGRPLVRFHRRVTRWLANIHPKRYMMVRSIYLPLKVATKAVIMEEVDMYILCRQNNVSQYIATQTILELCLETERRPGMRVSMRWW